VRSLVQIAQRAPDVRHSDFAETCGSSAFLEGVIVLLIWQRFAQVTGDDTLNPFIRLFDAPPASDP
jgi:hypothetical protein